MEIELCRGEIDLRPNETINLIGDIHSGSNSGYEIEVLKRHIKHLARTKKRRILWGGDLLDAQQFSGTPSVNLSSIEQDIEQFLEITKPIHEQTDAITWGNHEERLFRKHTGKGIMPNVLFGYLSIASKIEEKNPNLICSDLQKSVHLKINLPSGDSKNLVLKHGHKAGRTSYMSEHDEMLRLYSDIDIISLHHIHFPQWLITSQITIDGENKPVDIFRGSAYVAWSPFQDKKNLPPSQMGYWELSITKSGRIKPDFKRG